jgi:tetratricopeptide (TPR) repeat protein
MARLNQKTLVMLGLILFAVTGGVVYLVVAASPGPNYRAAIAALERRDFAAAADYLDKHLADHPTDREARLLAARTARRRGADDEFLNHIEAYKQAGGSETARAAEYRLLRVQHGDLSEAAVLLQQCQANSAAADSALALEAVIEGALLVLRPRSGQSWTLPAGVTDPVVALVRPAVELWLQSRSHPADRLQGWVWRGRVWAAAAEYPDAVADFRAVLAEDPQHFEARFNLAITILQENPVEAAEHLAQLREAQPDNSAVLAALAHCYRIVGRLDDARRVLKDMLARRPNDLAALIELGLLELDADRPVEAEGYLRQSLAQAPNDAQVNLALSRCLSLLGQAEPANQFLRRAEEIRSQRKLPKQ